MYVLSRNFAESDYGFGSNGYTSGNNTGKDGSKYSTLRQKPNTEKSTNPYTNLNRGNDVLITPNPSLDTTQESTMDGNMQLAQTNKGPDYDVAQSSVSRPIEVKYTRLESRNPRSNYDAITPSEAERLALEYEETSIDNKNNSLDDEDLHV